jgi:hypothetical protein
VSTAFHDLPPEAYPFTMIALTVAGDREVWRAEVDGPCAIYVPPLAEKFGEVRIRIEWGDGTVSE